MGKGSESTQLASESKSECNDLKLFTWNQVKGHNKKEDLWIVIKNNVYDVTNFHKKHPGGSKILQTHGGDDATEPFIAFHTNEEYVQKYMKTYFIGKIDEKNPIGSTSDKESAGETHVTVAQLERKDAMRKDFEQLRQIAIKMGLFKPSVPFYAFSIFHFIFFYVMGFVILQKFGNSWLSIITAMTCHVIGMSQAGWSQHDFGHLSVLKSNKLNRFFHILIMSYFKAASSHWWTDRHNLHHARTNLNGVDPDVRFEPLFLIGENQASKMAAKNAKKKNFLYDYRKQHFYFILGTALTIPVYLQYSNLKYSYSRKLWFELFTIIQMYIIHFYLTLPILGVAGALAYFLIMRVFESLWFTWVTQMSHIPMEVHDLDEDDTWFTLMLKSTCNVEQSLFNDWFTGHLNFQIEHHLFPTMPRHNLHKIQSLVQVFCRKHNCQYINKPLMTAFVDIVTSLAKSGKTWSETYEDLLNV